MLKKKKEMALISNLVSCESWSAEEKRETEKASKSQPLGK
jgi:hypothetical protein